MIKTYSEAMSFFSFTDRFRYLMLNGSIGDFTFNGHRHLNQLLYRCPEWKRIRREVIIRDNGCDLSDPDRPIDGRILVHHINPITIDDVRYRRKCIFDLENLICTSFDTHNALHYGDESQLVANFIERRRGDTCPWR